MGKSQSGDTARIGRREALVATTALGLAAGCAGPDQAPPLPRPRGGGTPWTPGPAAGSGASGTVVGPVSDVPVGGGKVFQALEVVVTQPVAGRFDGFSAICTHTGCILASVADGTINCPCHGSKFGLDGSVANGPAERPLNVRAVRANGGQIVLE